MQQKSRYFDMDGNHYDRKPEEMTQLKGNLLVPKTHPQIAFRGKLDSLSALMLRIQVTAMEQGEFRLADDLGKLVLSVYAILRAEALDEPLPEISLLGMDSAQLRHDSHYVKECFGIEHPTPSADMGRVCIELNYLRTQVREAELAAVRAFESPAGCTRPDIIEGMNRLSSCVYILFCRRLSGWYQ